MRQLALEQDALPAFVKQMQDKADFVMVYIMVSSMAVFDCNRPSAQHLLCPFGPPGLQLV